VKLSCDRCGAEHHVRDAPHAPGALRTVGRNGVRARCRKCRAEMVALPHLVLDRYRVVADLAQTRVGRFYVARDESTRTRARVSVLAVAAEVAPRARLAIPHAHPNVVRVVDADDAGFVVFERLDGRSLAAVDAGVRPGHPLPFEVAAHVTASVARALSWAHERGCAHGALDIDTTWLRADGSVKVIGLFVDSAVPVAKVRDSEATRDDVFRLGVLMFRLLTGAKSLPPDFRAMLHDAPSVLANLCKALLIDREMSARAAAGTLDVYASMNVTDPTPLLQRLSREDLTPPRGARRGDDGAWHFEDIDDTVELPRNDQHEAWCEAGAPSLAEAARHRATRNDITHSLGAADAHALADVVGRNRHGAVWWIEAGESSDAVGPVTFDELHRRACGGLASARGLVWCPGMPAWRELRHLESASGVHLFEPMAFQGSPASSLPARIWDYDIIRKLADGGQGVVYLARDPTNGYDVALKSISLETDGARGRFEREVHALIGTQGHPHITQLSRWKIDDAERRGYLAFSYIPGESLADIIAREKNGLAIERAVELAEQLGLALAKLHERYLVHRDLKPHNVMVRRDPGRETAVLIDLGIVKLTNVVSSSTNMISPQYAAPERFTTGDQGAPSGVDPRSDLYSLGLLLFEMLTGRHPFPTHDLLQLAIAHVQRPPPDPRELRVDVPAALAALVLQLLAKEPMQRPTSATAVVTKLRAIQTQLRSVVAQVPEATLTTRLRRALAIDSVP
jgi:serine/threonine protein kinase